MGANKMWNYRIIQTKPEEYGLYEVIYNEDGDISAYTEKPEVIAESPEDLLLSLRLMLDDAQKSYNNILKSDEIKFAPLYDESEMSEAMTIEEFKNINL